ncbi:hypothetical protein NL676_031691 [Syzygium grande]|nr:hypothetical protein NL676_031691 [Syzygium grande]
MLTSSQYDGARDLIDNYGKKGALTSYSLSLHRAGIRRHGRRRQPHRECRALRPKAAIPNCRHVRVRPRSSRCPELPPDLVAPPASRNPHADPSLIVVRFCFDCSYGGNARDAVGDGDTPLDGGSDKKGNILKSAELYDSSTGKWELLPSMHTPRRLCSGFFMDGKFYVIGGMSSPTDSLTCGEVYDLETKKWRKIERMYPNVNKAAQAPPLVAVVDNELYSVEHLTNMVKKYDKAKNTWDVLGRLPVKADSSNGWGLAFKACGKELLVVGGQRGPEGEAIVLNSWNPKSGVKNGTLDWKVLGVKENVGVFVYNCAVMGC